MKKETKLTIAFIALSFLIPMFFLELYLRFKGINATYEEQIGLGGYGYPYPDYIKPENIPVYESGRKTSYDQNEFRYNINANAAGFNDREWTVTKTKKRILCLGDSFTEGRGAVGDSSYPHLLQKYLHDSVEVYNAGIAGLDPFWCYSLLQNKLQIYNPDIIILSINNSDITDYISRGGFPGLEMAKNNIHRKPPMWSKVYSKYYTLRYAMHNVMHYNTMLLRPTEQKRMDEEANKKLMACADSFAVYGAKNNIDVYFLFQVMNREMIEKKIDCAATLEYCKAQGYNTIDLMDYFLKKGFKDNKEIAWPIDGHYNNKGYKLMAKSVAESIAAKNQKAEITRIVTK